MTPAEEYAQKRAEAESLIRQHAPERLQDSLIALLRPAIALSATRADDDDIPIGASKFGGAPDVPSDFKWPKWNDKPLGFLAQINLEEVAAFDIENKLPKSGLLSFFYFMDDDDTIYGEAGQQDGWRVFYFQNGILSRESNPNILDSVLSTMSIEGRVEFTSIDDFECVGVSWRDYDLDEYFAFKDKFGDRNPCHRLLGFSKVIQHEPGYTAALNSKKRGENKAHTLLLQEALDWQLLFQFDSDDELDTCWGDGGTLYFMLRHEDLAQHRFERTWLVMDCS